MGNRNNIDHFNKIILVITFINVELHCEQGNKMNVLAAPGRYIRFEAMWIASKMSLWLLGLVFMCPKKFLIFL